MNYCLNKRLFFLIPIVLSALMFVPSIPKAHAATGLVCITSTTATGCPASPPAFGPVVVGTTFTVGVFIQGSDAMGGFDIYVKADTAVLNATGADLGPLIVNPALTSICVNGVAQTGACTVQAANGPGVVEATTIENTGGNECGGLSPCSGMAFFINYTVVGSALTTGLSYPTAAGCAVSSVSSPVNVCVLVADSLGTALPENVQGASVIQTTAKDFLIVAAPSSLTVGQGSVAVSNITLTSINGATGTVVFQTTPPPGCLDCPIWSMVPATVILPPGGSNVSSLIFSTNLTTPVANWNVTVTASLGTISHNVSVLFKIALVSPSPDFIISASPASLVVSSGSTNSSTITLQSINQLSGLVFLTVSPPPSCSVFPCLSWSLSTNEVSLVPGATAVAYLTVDGGQQATSGSIMITASYGSIAHQISVAYQVQTPPPDFYMNTYPSSFLLPAGSTVTSQIYLYSAFYSSASFNVALTATVQPPNGPTATLSPTMVTISSTSSAFTTLTISSIPSTPVGNYTITVTGHSSAFTHSITLFVQVLPPPTIKLTPTTGPVGTKVQIQASGFIPQFGLTEVLVTFDDQLLGFTFTSTGSFNFTFNVPTSQTGPHVVKAYEPGFGTGFETIIATASFTVTPSPSSTSLAVSITTGTIYFPGDTASALILVTQNGQPASPADLQLTVTLFEANGSSIVLTTTKVSAGKYSATFNIPTTSKGAGPLGTYEIVAFAHSASIGDSTAQASFEVKPTWLSSNGKTLVTGVALVGLAGVFGVAWRKGYLRKKDEEDLTP